MGKLSECFLHICVLFCWAFVKEHITILGTKSFTVYCRNSSLAIKVWFVTNNKERKLLGFYRCRLSQENLLPIKDLIKRFVICHIIYDTATVSTSVERRAQRLVSLLSCCVPNLEYHWLALYFHLFVRKVCAYRRLKRFCKSLVVELLNEWCLSDRWVADDYKLDKVFLGRFRYNAWSAQNATTKWRVVLFHDQRLKFI